MKVIKHAIKPTTNFAAQLSTRGTRNIFPGGYYAASGILDNGDRIEMIIAQEREPGLMGESTYVYVALNGKCNRRRYALDGTTASLADWLRGHHFGHGEPVEYLTGTAKQLLTDLYADTKAL